MGYTSIRLSDEVLAVIRAEAKKRGWSQHQTIKTYLEKKFAPKVEVKKPVGDDFSDDVKNIYEHYKSVMKTDIKLTDTRIKLINARLKECDAFKIMRAIDGCSMSPFNMGQNDNKKKYNQLEFICRNLEKIEDFSTNTGVIQNAKLSNAEQAREQTKQSLNDNGQLLGFNG